MYIYWELGVIHEAGVFIFLSFNEALCCALCNEKAPNYVI